MPAGRPRADGSSSVVTAPECCSRVAPDRRAGALSCLVHLLWIDCEGDGLVIGSTGYERSLDGARRRDLSAQRSDNRALASSIKRLFASRCAISKSAARRSIASPVLLIPVSCRHPREQWPSERNGSSNHRSSAVTPASVIAYTLRSRRSACRGCWWPVSWRCCWLAGSDGAPRVSVWSSGL